MSCCLFRGFSKETNLVKIKKFRVHCIKWKQREASLAAKPPFVQAEIFFLTAVFFKFLFVVFFALSSFINILKSRSSSSVQGFDWQVKSTFFGSLISPIFFRF